MVAAITLPSLITKIKNKGYVEGCKKAYNILQTATNSIVDEEGSFEFITQHDTPETNASNQIIIDKYEARLKVLKRCQKSNYIADNCQLGSGNYYYLNGTLFNNYIFALYKNTCIVLLDGIIIAFAFKNNESGDYRWGAPNDLLFIVDVNGKKGPNKYGRDIFIFTYNTNNHKVEPYKNTTNNDCHKDGAGTHCAYRIITEGKMNY